MLKYATPATRICPPRMGNSLSFLWYLFRCYFVCQNDCMYRTVIVSQSPGRRYKNGAPKLSSFLSCFPIMMSMKIALYTLCACPDVYVGLPIRPWLLRLFRLFFIWLFSALESRGLRSSKLQRSSVETLMTAP